MSPLRSVNRTTRLDLYRRAEKVLLSEARPYWLGTRPGLKRIVRRYVRRYGEASGLRVLLRSGALTAATALFLLQLYAMPMKAQAASTPVFSAPNLTNAFGLDDVGDYSSPAFADLDGDGDLDMIGGNSDGYLVYFENTGSSSAPAFAAAIENPFGLDDVGDYSSPAFADLDGDGDLDLISGNSDGYLVYFENTGSSSAPAFAAAIENPFGLTYVENRSSPTFADLNGDGDFDLISGQDNGDLIYFENTGSSSAPAFATAIENPFGLVDIGDYSSPVFADLNGDGDLDLISGDGEGDFYYLENTGSSSAPAFAAAVPNSFGLANIGDYSIPAFTDLDGDGDLDLIGGERDGTFTYIENTGSSNAPAFVVPTPNPFGFADVGSYSFPAFVDLDGDGDIDLIIGERYGNFLYFENTDSSSGPAFAASSTNPFGLGNIGQFFSSPAFVDLDGDDDLDLISGGTHGNFIYFENTGSSSAPAFTSAIENPFGFADVGSNSIPVFADLDGDSDLDLISGEAYGNFFYLENTGSSSAPAFAPATTDPFGFTDVGRWSSPAFADLDNDGDLDMISGNTDGNFIYFENTGSSSAPAFASVTTNPFGFADIGSRSVPTFADLDGDADLDVLSGGAYGNFYYFENTTIPPVPVVMALDSAFGAPGDTLRINALLTNENTDPVGGLQIVAILGDPSVAHFVGLEDTTGISGFTVSTNTANDSTRILLFSGSGAVIQPGTDIHVATLLYALDPVAALGSTIDLTSADLQIADSFGLARGSSAVNGQLQIGIRGDVTLDARVTVLDLIKLVRFILGKDAAPADGSTAFNIADADGNAGIDVADVITQVNSILGIIPGPTKVITGAPVTVSLGAVQVTPDGRSVIPVYLSDPGSIVGAQGILQFDSTAVGIGTPQLAAPRDGLYVDSFVKDGTLRFVVYDTRADGRIAQPDAPMLLIPVTGVTNEQVSVMLSGVRLANRSAQSIQVTTGNMTVSLSSKVGIPLSFGLRNAAPNPFNPSTAIAYHVPQQAHITLTVYNLLGQEVVRLVDSEQAPGRYQAVWHGTNAQGQAVASGVYLYRMTADTGFTRAHRMTLVK